jgi:hypothetical protein
METVITTTYRGNTRGYNSANGNPRFILHTDDGNYHTSPDASISYDIENHSGRPEHAPNAGRTWINKRVKLTLERGKVIYWALATDKG